MLKRVFLLALCATPILLHGCSGDPEMADPYTLLAVRQPPPQTPSIHMTAPVPNVDPAHVFPTFTASWETENAKRVRWALVSLSAFDDDPFAAADYLRGNREAAEWSEWVKCKPRKNEGTSNRFEDVDTGAYLLAVQGSSPRGDLTDVTVGENAVRLRVGNRTTGPLLTVSNEFIGTIVTATVETPPTLATIPAGQGMSFDFSADASAYGGTVDGYRYGWDVLDPDDPEQWEIDWTPFIDPDNESTTPERTFFFGVHVLLIEVRDTEGIRSRVPIHLQILPESRERPLLTE